MQDDKGVADYTALDEDAQFAAAAAAALDDTSASSSIDPKKKALLTLQAVRVIAPTLLCRVLFCPTLSTPLRLLPQTRMYYRNMCNPPLTPTTRVWLIMHCRNMCGHRIIFCNVCYCVLCRNTCGPLRKWRFLRFAQRSGTRGYCATATYTSWRLAHRGRTAPSWPLVRMCGVETWLLPGHWCVVHSFVRVCGRAAFSTFCMRLVVVGHACLCGVFDVCE